MTTRYEIRQVNPKFIDIHIAGIPSSAGCKARVPVRDGRENIAREFAAHIVSLLNHDNIEQARRANMAEALQDYAERTGLDGTRSVPYDSPPAPRTPTPDERWQQC